MKNAKDGNRGWICSRFLENSKIIIVAGFLLLVFSLVLSCAQESQGTVNTTPSLPFTSCSEEHCRKVLLLPSSHSGRGAMCFS